MDITFWSQKMRSVRTLMESWIFESRRCVVIKGEMFISHPEMKETMEQGMIYNPWLCGYVELLDSDPDNIEELNLTEEITHHDKLKELGDKTFIGFHTNTRVSGYEKSEFNTVLSVINRIKLLVMSINVYKKVS